MLLRSRLHAELLSHKARAIRWQNLRACSLMERAERLECLDKLLRNIAPPARPAPAAENWTVSETMSPVDYSPIVFAVTPSRDGAEGSAMQLSVSCRNGRTELVIAGPAVAGPRRRLCDLLSHQWRRAGASGGGRAIVWNRRRIQRRHRAPVAVVPGRGRHRYPPLPRTGAAHEGHFSLGGLKSVRDKLAAACKWPQAVAKPRN